MSEQATHDWVIGCELSVTTQSEDIRGQVFAFDKSTNTVVLRQPGSTPFHSNLRLLKVNFIKAVETIAPAKSPPSPLPVIDIQRSREREAKALQAAHAEAAKTGVGVTIEAQQVFDALAKTMPCQWKQTSIVVLNEVEVSPPYGLGNCTTEHANDTTTLERVKKVLTAERQRMGLD